MIHPYSTRPHLSQGLSRLGTLAALLVTTSGCFGSVAEVKHRHFLLDGKWAADVSPAPDPSGKSLWVKDFQVDAVYDRAQLVRRRGPHEVSFVRNDVWAARVGRMVADSVARHWTALQLFASVNRNAGEANPDVTLQGDITALEVVAPGGGQPAVAHFAWVLQLVARASGKTIGQHVFDETAPLGESQDGVAAVQALNTLIGRAAEGGALALGQALRRAD